ncbi:MAG: glycoside hydrolase family 15 protein [Actinomycetota bacterium]|nr:glycoside hydrolase family 15 protein [Actinomycetota bacterium]
MATDRRSGFNSEARSTSSTPLERYSIIGDTHSVALVDDLGSIDWLCLPRFDSDACFAKLLGNDENGFWRLSPIGGVISSNRSYVDGTLVLVTEYLTDSGVVRVTDFMPKRSKKASIVRIVAGVSGSVRMRCELVVRFGYGRIVPWMRREGDHLHGVAGPDSICISTPVELNGENYRTVGDFEVSGGDEVAFVLSWQEASSFDSCGGRARDQLEETISWWQRWSSRCTYHGPYRSQVIRSLVTLKALTYEPSGGIVAAATTSLPEMLGGGRNWDYRYCWLRDASFSLVAFMECGYTLEPRRWLDWLLRAIAGQPSQIQIMYGVAGERRLTEFELEWLDGYGGSKPVRIGNAASSQVQLDVFGEVASALYSAREIKITPDPNEWKIQVALTEHVEDSWRSPDDGIWEVRSKPRHFVHSKIMAWVALDRAIKSATEFDLPAPLERWKASRDDIRSDVLKNGVDRKRGCLTRSYGSSEVDASLLLAGTYGFLDWDDPLFEGTVRAVREDLINDGLLLRYKTDDGAADGLSGSEGAFLACSFWLVEALAEIGEVEEATELFDRLLSISNEVGLLSEEYDTREGRLVGNFPQAFSHVGVINAALSLDRVGRRRL